MMTVTLTCEECGSGIHVKPDLKASKVKCDVCQKVSDVTFSQEHMEGLVRECPCCQRKDFYKQKDFNRKVGVALFVIAAILAIWTYGISLIVLWIFDLLSVLVTTLEQSKHLSSFLVL